VKEAKELASSLTACSLSNPVATQNKNLLQSILQLYAELDEISFNTVARALEPTEKESNGMSPEVFDRHLETIKSVAMNRPKNLINWLLLKTTARPLLMATRAEGVKECQF